jgi:hypothetical protein
VLFHEHLKDLTATPAAKMKDLCGKGSGESTLAKRKTAEVAVLWREGHPVFSRGQGEGT